MVNYQEYICSEKWKLKRKLKAKQSEYTCEICGKVKPTKYNIHHKTYKNLGNEPLSDLMFLCYDCHTNIHISLRAIENNKNKKEKDKKICSNCKFSKEIDYKKYKNKKPITILYCTYHLKNCDENICKNFKK